LYYFTETEYTVPFNITIKSHNAETSGLRLERHRATPDCVID